MVTAVDELEAVTRPLLRALSEATGLDSTYLTRIRMDAAVQEIVYSRNEGELEITEGLEVAWEDTLCKRALESGRTCTSDVPDVWGDSEASRVLGIVTYVSTPIYLADGSLYGTLCGASSRPLEIHDRDQALLRLFAEVVSDQLERERAARRAEARAREAELALEERATFLAQAEHSLKTPITAIKGFADLLTTAWEKLSEEDKRRDVQQISRAAGHLTARIHELLDEARATVLVRDLQPQPIDLLGFSRELCQELAGLSDRHELRVTGEERIASIDARALRLILEHLVENAVKYSPEGGTVTIEVDGSADVPELRVHDHGVGIPEGTDIFAPFERGSRDTDGAGLGLFIVANLVDAMDGEVSAERNPDRGSTFVVRLQSSGK